jgi:hypothetical protein
MEALQQIRDLFEGTYTLRILENSFQLLIDIGLQLVVLKGNGQTLATKRIIFLK